MKTEQRMWRFVRLTCAVAVVLGLAAGCGTTEEPATPSPAEAGATAEAAAAGVVAAYPLAASAWDLDYFFTPEEKVPVLPDTRASVVYFWDRYAGFDGCNWFLGVYSANDQGELRMQAPAETPNLCMPQELATQAALFKSSLWNTTEYEREGEQLIANTVNDQRLLTLNPAKPVPMPGTVWGLAFWWDEERMLWRPVPLIPLTTIAFGEGGQASGFGGCNDYSATYEGDLQIEKVMEATATYAELPTLTFGPITAQMKACAAPEGIMDQEQGFFAALDSVAYYFKLGGMLMMLDAKGTPLVVLSAGH